MPISKIFRVPVTISEHELAERCAHGRIVVIDDDEEILSAFSALLELSGYACETYLSAIDYLHVLNYNRPCFAGPCCVLCDVNMSELNGLELQRQLAKLGDTPVLLMSGVCGVFEVIRAFRAGALDFLVKPIDADQLLEAVQKALAISSQRQELKQRLTLAAERLASLTEREREITQRVVRGQTNQAIASELGIALRTVKLYRQRAMKKIGAETIADFIRIFNESDTRKKEK